jgi:hypothetical protein
VNGAIRVSSRLDLLTEYLTVGWRCSSWVYAAFTGRVRPEKKSMTDPTAAESSNSVGIGVWDLDLGARVGAVQTWTYDVSNDNAFGVGRASREMMHMRGEEAWNRQTQTLGLGSLENAIRGPSVRQPDSKRDRYRKQFPRCGCGATLSKSNPSPSSVLFCLQLFPSRSRPSGRVGWAIDR